MAGSKRGDMSKFGLDISTQTQGGRLKIECIPKLANHIRGNPIFSEFRTSIVVALA